jgi:hypothetical protein
VTSLPPTVTSFAAPAGNAQLTIPISEFTATDDVAVTGYLVTETSSAPLPTDPRWAAAAPAAYTVATAGSYTLYPWVKDADDQVSAVYGSPASALVSATGTVLLTDSFCSGPTTNDNLAGRQIGTLAPLTYTVVSSGTCTIESGGYFRGNNAYSPDHNFNSAAGDSTGGVHFTVRARIDPELLVGANSWMILAFGATIANRNSFPGAGAPVQFMFRSDGSFSAEDNATNLTPLPVQWAPPGDYRATWHTFEIYTRDLTDNDPFNGVGVTEAFAFVDGNFVWSHVFASPGLSTNYVGIYNYASDYNDDLVISKGDTLPCLSSPVVTSSADSGAGTLRQALLDVCSGGTILIDPSLSGATVRLASTLSVTKNVTIDGSAPATKLTLNGDTDSNGTGDLLVLSVDPGVTATAISLIVTKGSTAAGARTGGIRNQGNLTVASSSFFDNDAKPGNWDGGAILNEVGGVLSLVGCTFTGNTARDGGAVVNNGTANIADCTFSSNSGIGSGGALVSSGSLTVTGSTFASNTSADRSGGIYVSGGTATISGCTLNGNSGYWGGALYTAGTVVDVANCTIAANGATQDGGGLYVGGGMTNLVNCTFFSNTAVGGPGILNGGGTLNMTNTIVAGPQTPLCSGGLLTNKANLIQDGTCSPAMSGDPLLAALGSYGGPTQTIPLLPGSPAIDVGDFAACSAAPVSALDQRGIVRSFGGGCDLGAFESRQFTFANPMGTPQSTAINTSFPSPLAFSVDSAFAEPVDGGQVTFTAPGSGASASITGNPATISAGIASASATANGTAGAYQVAATAAGASGASVLFDLTNTSTCSGTITVTSTADSGAGSLRQAVADVCAGGTIDFGLTPPATIGLSAEIPIAASMTISGPGAKDLTISGGGTNRIFNVGAGSVTLGSLKIAGGTAGGSGGGIFVNSGADLSLDSVQIESCNAGNGGGLYVANGASASVLRSTFVGGTAIAHGGAIAVEGTLALLDSTIFGNSTQLTGAGAGVYFGPAAAGSISGCTIAGNTTTGSDPSGLFGVNPILVRNSILAGNQSGDCNQMNDGGHNIVLSLPCTGAGNSGRTLLGIDPLLGTYGDHGGNIGTIPVDPASPAIDQGDPATCSPADAIGTGRPFGHRCDIGAFETTTLPTCGGGWPTPVLAGPWAMFSPPCDTFTLTPGDLYGDDMGSGVYDADWVMWYRDAALDVYTKLGLATPTPAIGAGFWFRTIVPPTGGVLTTLGSEYSVDLSVAQTGDAAGRLNLLGNPFTSWVYWPNVQVDYSSALHPLQQAQTDGIMSQQMAKWNGAAYQIYDPSVPGQEGMIWRGEAFWTKVWDVSGPNLVLPAPPPGAMAGKEIARAAASRPAPLRAGEWTVRLTASSGRTVDPGNLLGRLDGASGGWDSRDLREPAPPSFATTWLTVVFPHAEWGDRGGDYTTDFRPLDGSKGDSWDFEVRSSLHDRPIALSWSGPTDVVGCSHLVDLESGAIVDTGAQGSYSFALTGASRAFRWVLSTPSVEERLRPRAEEAR